MNVSLLVLALWLSSTMAPDSPTKVPSPVLDPSVSKYPTPSPDKWVPKEAAKLPAKTTAAKLLWKPGSYAAESLKLPQALPIEQFDAWNQGPGWPQVDGGVVVVTDNAKDSHRFLAFLVDVKAQRIVAIRDGDKAKHLMIIGQTQAPVPSESGLYPGGVVPPSIMQLAGSGAVIILRPPVPPGPAGVPDDLVAKILDSATIASQAGAWMAGVP
jgi:hypothetical protein